METTTVKKMSGVRSIAPRLNELVLRRLFWAVTLALVVLMFACMRDGIKKLRALQELKTPVVIGWDTLECAFKYTEYVLYRSYTICFLA
jgi:hypothetical protein